MIPGAALKVRAPFCLGRWQWGVAGNWQSGELGAVIGIGCAALLFPAILDWGG
jgi:hypothetical protein